MKLPSFRELSKEQDKIYNLPLTSNYLVSGPPGTGKTVIALYRASMYKEQKQTPILLSYSKLLTSYTGDAAGELKIDGLIKTYHSWIGKTYWNYFHENPPTIADWEYDWMQIVPKLFTKMMVNRPYLLIDEGQDLPPDFYAAAALMSKNLTVFADENQRITNTQSTFEDIKRQGGIKLEHKLTRNYRNTKQIASVAACFYAGMPTGKPDIPEREGPLPIIQNTKNFDDAINLISRFERNNGHLQVGVFTKSTDFQQRILEKLKANTKNEIEFYNSRTGSLPSFKKPGVKLITFNSAKGLEFDAVFIPEIQGINMDMSILENKMMFYVLLSRAREHLYLLYSSNGKPPILQEIPDEVVEFRQSK